MEYRTFSVFSITELEQMSSIIWHRGYSSRPKNERIHGTHELLETAMLCYIFEFVSTSITSFNTSEETISAP